MTKKLIRIATVPLALRYLLAGQMKFMKENGFDVLMISADGAEREAVIQNETCRHIIVPMTRKITPLQDLQCLFQLIKIFKKEKPDIVHTHTPKAGLLGMIAAKTAGVKIRIHTVAGMPFVTRGGFTFYLLKLMEKFTYRAANHVWPNSHSLYQYILQNNLTTQKKLKVIAAGSSNGINLSRFSKQILNEKILAEIKDQLKFEKENFYLLFIGRLVYDKGLVEMIDAFNSLREKYTRLKLVLVGRFESDLDPLPAKSIQQIESNPSIIHIDWTDKTEYYLSIANCFIFPSHREGFPNVLLQAGAMHLPVICSRIPGNVDIVEHKITGLIFEKGNEKKMAECIAFAINNPEQMKNMADNLHKKIHLTYRQEDVWKSILNQYNLLIS